MTEEIKAITEVAKATGKLTDAAREFGGWVAKITAGPVEQGMGIFEDKLKYMRWERQVALMDKVNNKIAERGLDGASRAVPLKLTIPILQAASMEDDDTLQNLWANLLVNAADINHATEIRHTYITILKDLTSFDALILQRAYSNEISQYTTMGVCALSGETHDIELTEVPTDQVPETLTLIAIENLDRLGLLRGCHMMGSGIIIGVTKTRLGGYFSQACMGDKITSLR